MNNHQFRSSWGTVLGRSFTAIIVIWLTAPVFAGALEDYVGKPDTNYFWTVVTNRETDGMTVTHLNLTSQKWRDGQWTHHMQVVQPAKVRNSQIGFLFIIGDGDGAS